MPSSVIYGLLLSRGHLRIHNEDYSLVEHDGDRVGAVSREREEDGEQEGINEAAIIVAVELEVRQGDSSTGDAALPDLTPTSPGGRPRKKEKTMKRGTSMLDGDAPTTRGGKAATSAVAAPRRGTFTSSTLIYITSCFGASCLGMPWCFAQCGWALGLILLALTALITQWGAGLLLRCAQKVSGEPSGGVSIKQVAIVASPHLTSLPELVVVVNCLGSSIGALVVSGFLLPRTFQNLASLSRHYNKELLASAVWEDLLRERLLWISVILACVLPLCFLRDITPLKYTGLVSLFAVVFTTAVVAAAHFLPLSFDTCEVVGHSPCATNVVAFRTDNVTGVLAAIPTFFFNYSSNYQLLTVHNSLAIKSTKTSNLAIATCMSIITLTYAALGLTTYFTFGTDLQSNFLGNYGNNVLLDLARLFIIVSVALLFPLTIFTARASVMSMLGPKFLKRHNSKRVFFTTTMLLIAFAFVVAISVANLNVILGVGGALSTVPITLVLPGSYTTSLAKHGPAGESDRRKGRLAMYSGYALTFLCLYGALAMQ